MTLLREVMEQPLDPGYALAAARRDPGRRRSPLAVAVTVLVAVVCGWGFAWSVVELRRPRPEALSARAQIEEEVRRRTEAVEQAQARNEALQRQITAAQARVLETGGGSALADRARALSAVSGEAAVTGPGLQITLDDAPRDAADATGADPRDAQDSDQGRVLDRDLQLVVNGLWAAGAEAVAVNGQRLTSLSAIRSAGQAILVDYRPLRRPYVVDAIGDAAALQTRFASDMAGPYVQSLRDNYGVQVTLAAQEQLRLPGASSLTLRAARVPAPAASSSPSSTAGTSPSASPSSSPSPEVSP